MPGFKTQTSSSDNETEHSFLFAYAATSSLSLENKNFKIIGVMTEELMMSKITAVKYSDEIIPTDRHFWATINATSPRVIIPTPIFKESDQLNRQSFAIKPQPIILVRRATITKQRLNNRNLPFIAEKVVFKPIPTKKIGAKII